MLASPKELSEVGVLAGTPGRRLPTAERQTRKLRKLEER